MADVESKVEQSNYLKEAQEIARQAERRMAGVPTGSSGPVPMPGSRPNSNYLRDLYRIARSLYKRIVGYTAEEKQRMNFGDEARQIAHYAELRMRRVSTSGPIPRPVKRPKRRKSKRLESLLS